MSDLLGWGLVVLALVGGAYALVRCVLGRLVDDLLFWMVAAVTVGLLVQLVAGSAALAVTDREIIGVTFVGYLLTAVVVPPVGVLWGVADKSRWGPAVVVVAMVTVAALQVRLFQLWSGQS